MMFFLVIMVLIVLLCFIRQVKSNKLSKKIAIIYSIWTLTILAISTVNPFDLYKVSITVYMLWLVNISVFVFTILAFNIRKQYNEIESKELYKKIEKSKFIFWISIIIMMLLIYYKVKYNSIIANLSLEDIRMARFDKLFENGVEAIFFDYIIIGTLRILLIITSILIVNGKLKNKICIISIIDLLLYTTIGYGRMTIFEFVVYLIIAYVSCDKNKIRVSIKKIIIYTLIFCMLLIIGAILVVIRLQGKDNLNIENVFQYGIIEQMKQIIIYFIGGFRTLDIFIKNGFPNINTFMMGRLSIGGIEDIIGLILNNIGYSFNTINSLIGTSTQSNVQIGNNIYMNAFYTCIMNYYGDFGHLGVIICPILHGLLINIVLNVYYKNKDIVSYMILAYVVMNALSSIYRWNYQGGSNVFLLVFMIILLVIKNKILKRKMK